MSLLKTWNKLFKHYGHQHWWPGDTPFEVMVGAVLTQNTAWINVERAITNLKAAKLLNARKIINAPQERLADLLRPSGYFNIKAKRLTNYCRWYVEQGELQHLEQWSTPTLRKALLEVNGIGPETADDILLYAFNRPVFVIDAYTRRIFSRLGLVTGDEGYETLRNLFEQSLKGKTRLTQTELFSEYHALIVIHAKDVCKKKPLCHVCCLASLCKLG